MRKIREVLTPENVFIEYELAGIGSRLIALAIDTLIQFAAIILVMIGLTLGGMDLNSLEVVNSWLVAVGIVLIFIIFFGYYIIFEMLMGGQSPGKKVARLRVIKQTGGSIDFFDSFLRNILRLADFIPSFYLLGAVMVIFTKDYKRVGDFAANTVVIKVKNVEKLVTAEDLLKRTHDIDKLKPVRNIYPVTNYEYSVLKEFLERKNQLGDRRSVFAFHLNRYFMNKFSVKEGQYTTPYDFFDDILRMNSGI